MAPSRTTTFIAGGLTALVVGSGTAYAATGGNFILGKSNSAGATTVLSNPNGTALSLNSKAGTPPLKVNRTAKVPKLNADLVDGKHATAFALAAGRTNSTGEPGFAVDADEDGLDDFVIAVAICPTGTILTGGGGDDMTPDGTLFLNSPWDKRTWVVASTTAELQSAEAVWAYAVCYNPRGAASGDFRAAPKMSDATEAAIKEKLAQKLAAR